MTEAVRNIHNNNNKHNIFKNVNGQEGSLWSRKNNFTMTNKHYRAREVVVAAAAAALLLTKPASDWCKLPGNMEVKQQLTGYLFIDS